MGNMEQTIFVGHGIVHLLHLTVWALIGAIRKDYAMVEFVMFLDQRGEPHTTPPKNKPCSTQHQASTGQIVYFVFHTSY